MQMRWACLGVNLAYISKRFTHRTRDGAANTHQDSGAGSPSRGGLVHSGDGLWCPGARGSAFRVLETSRVDDVMMSLNQRPPGQAEAAGMPQGPCWPLPIRARGSWLPRGWGLRRGGAGAHTPSTPRPPQWEGLSPLSHSEAIRS